MIAEAEYRRPLRQVGVALVVVGVIDIVYMVYCIARLVRYQSSFNIFAVVAGILLLRGSLRAARVVAFFSAFILTGLCGGVLLIAFFGIPFDLMWTYLRLRPLAAVGWGLLTVLLLGLLAWIYRTLTSPTVLAAMDDAKVNYRRFTRRPSTGFIAGALLLVLLFVFAGRAMTGPVKERAVAEARKEVGAGYRFGMISLYENRSGGRTRVDAAVIAYNDREIREVPVSWEE